MMLSAKIGHALQGAAGEHVEHAENAAAERRNISAITCGSTPGHRNLVPSR